MADPQATMDDLIRRARAEGLWLWTAAGGLWRTPDELATEIAAGSLPRGAWELKKPDAAIALLRGCVEAWRFLLQHAEAELARAIRAKREIDGAQ